MDTPMGDVVAKIKSLGKIVQEKKSGQWYYIAQCPAHPDKTPSLAVGQDSQGILMLKCFGGCSCDSILNSLGLEKKDMLPEHLKKEFKKKITEGGCTLEGFAARKKLPIDFLKKHGLENKGSCFKITYRDCKGEDLKRYRLRISLSGKKHTIWDSDFKGEKISAYGLQYLPWAKNSKYLVIVEGESDALTLWYNDIPALGAPGASNIKTIPVNLLNGIEHIFISCEPDSAGQKFPKDVKKHLLENRYAGKIYKLDFSKIKEGSDISDVWININANENEFKTLIKKYLEKAQEAQAPDIPIQEDKHVIDDDYDPKRLPSLDSLLVVQHYIKTDWTRAGIVCLKKYDCDFFEFEKDCWKEIPDDLMNAKIIKYLSGMQTLVYNKKAESFDWKLLHIKHSFVKEIIAMLSNDLIVLDGKNETPFWIKKPNDWRHENIYIAMKNGIFEIKQRKTIPLTPNYFNLSTLDFEYNPTASAPVKWLEFLNQLFPEAGEKDQITALQQWFGYCLSGKTNLQKMLLIIGLKRSGKGTIAKILTKILGENQVTNPTLNSFCENKGMQSIIGKSLAVFNDVRLGYKADNTIAVERLLSISGEDMISVPRMYKRAVELKPACRIMLISNILPKFNDASTALASRFIILKINQSFLGNENLQLFEELKSELPGIFNWALEGLAQIKAFGRIKEPAVSVEIMSELENLQSPTMSFCKDSCVFGDQYFVGKTELYDAWKNWCEVNGTKPTGKIVFFRDLSSVHFGLKSYQKRLGYNRKYVIEGIDLNSDFEEKSSGWKGYDD